MERKIKAKFSNGVIKPLEKLAPEGLALSIVSLAEVYEGVFYSCDPQKSEKASKEFLTGIPIFEIEKKICKIFGRERGKFKRLPLHCAS